MFVSFLSFPFPLFYIFLIVFILLIIQFAFVFKRGGYSGKTFLGIILKSGLAALGIIIVLAAFNLLFSRSSSLVPSSDSQSNPKPTVMEEIAPSSPSPIDEEIPLASQTPLDTDLTPSSAQSSPSPTLRIGSGIRPSVTVKPPENSSLPKTGGDEKEPPPIVQPKVPEAGGLGETLFWGTFGIGAFALGLLL